MHAAVVIPCLNEEALIETTAQSLGFGQGCELTPSGSLLILVDNGSQDGTLGVLEHIREASRPGSVFVVSQPERGYIPARHSGMLAVRDYIEAAGLSANDVLVLQADADTLYEEGYIEAMRAAAIAAGPNTLIEGITHPPQQFLHDYPGYQQLSDLVDTKAAPLFVTEQVDVIVDDKVSGFSLATYFAWGGHRREYNSKGAELHAETARLFIRGKIRGGAKIRAEGAFAAPSRRKIIENPIRHFASAGFPREESWWRAWRTSYTGPMDLASFEGGESRARLAPVIATRTAHIIVLFGILPNVLERILRGSSAAAPLHPLIQEMVNTFPQNDATNLDKNLAPLFEHAFRLIDNGIDTLTNP